MTELVSQADCLGELSRVRGVASGRNGFDAFGAVQGRVLGNGAERDEIRQCSPR